MEREPAAANAGVASVFDANRFERAFVDAGALTDPADAPVPVELVARADWASWLSEQAAPTQAWIKSTRGESWAPGVVISLPSFAGPNVGGIEKIVVTINPLQAPVWAVAGVVRAVPAARNYAIERDAGLTRADIELGWALGSYSYNRYKNKKPSDKSGAGDDAGGEEPQLPRLVQTTTGAERLLVESSAGATYMVRDIINAPAEDFGPAELEAAASALAAQRGARATVIVGDQLLRRGYPQVHTVGRAAGEGRAPRLVELVWNEGATETVTLVGKGVCYDTGGLSIKPTGGMITMKKDLGGAAQVLGLARMIIDHKLDVRLRVLVPAVENSIAGDAFRPGDVLTARNGMTTLNANSDAEGRLILADALAAAAEEGPALIIDCATLTGAQRVALGTDIPGLFSNDDDVAKGVCDGSDSVHDLVWRLPLHAPYKKLIESHIADVKSCGSGPYGGAITAALYLQEFVDGCPWIHIDFMGYNSSSSPGRPEGGEAMGMRALFRYLHTRFAAR